jgi:putative colanic acid biosynthesis acetyltransferase WcaF
LNLSTYNHSFTLKNKLLRVLWNITWFILFRPFASRLFKKYRVLVLKCFGAKIDWSSHIYASVRIWAQWNLRIGKNSSIGPESDCYNQGTISIGDNTVISQKTYLCASTHNYNKTDFPLILKPITIGDGVWVAAGAFIGPGIVIKDYAIVAACSVVSKNVDQNTIVGGNPAKFIKFRNFE